MNYKKLTKIFVLATIAIIIGFDVFVWVKGGTEATVSWTVFEWSYDYPILPFFMGFVMGHFFWQMKPKAKLEESKK